MGYRNALIALVALLSLGARLGSAATFTVSNSADSGAGSLRQAMLDANTAGGANTIQWSGVGGRIPAASALPSAGNLTFDVSAATSEPIIEGDISIGTNLTVNGRATLAGTLSGTGSVTKSGTYLTLTLVGTNTYTGGTIVNGGFASAIDISRDNNLGSAGTSVTLNSASGLEFTADAAIARPIHCVGSLAQIHVNGFNVTFSGAVDGTEFEAFGGGTATFSGPITVTLGVVVGNLTSLVLSGSNAFTSFTYIGNQAVLGVSSAANLSASTVIDNDGGTFRMLGPASISQSYYPGLIGSGVIGSFDTNGYDTILTGPIGSTFTFVKTGLGTLTLSGDDGAFTGGMRVDQGYLTATSSSAFGSGPVALNGGGLTLGTTQLILSSVSGTGNLAVSILGAGSYGVIHATSTSLSGLALTISPNSFTPPAGSTFTIITATSVVGQFASVSYPAGQNYAVTYLSTAVVLQALTTAAVTTIGTGGGTAQLVYSAGPIVLTVPGGAFLQSQNVSLSVPVTFPGASSSAGNLTPSGLGVQIDLGLNLEPVSPVYLAMTYSASIAAGLDPSKFIIARYDTARGTWVPLPSAVDTASKVVTASTSHLSLFQLMQSSPSDSLSNVKAFPNPMRPALGQTAMTFSLLPGSARIRIYTLTGELVKDLTAAASGLALWDGTNQSGRPVASGVYFVLVQGGKQTRTIEVAVQR